MVNIEENIELKSNGAYSLTKTEINKLNRSEKREIKKDKFEKLKKRLKEFSINEDHFTLKNLEKETEKVLIVFNKDKIVTAKEINDGILPQISQHLITLNDRNNKTIKEFETIYSLFDELDEEYIKSIVGTLNAVELTTQNLSVTQNELLENTTSLEKAKEHQKKIIEELVRHRDQIKKIQHLEDVDQLWKEYQRIISEQRDIQNLIQKQEENVEKINLELLEKQTITENSITERQQTLEQKIVTLEDKYKEKEIEFKEKIKYAYFIGGGAGILALIEFGIILAKLL